MTLRRIFAQSKTHLTFVRFIASQRSQFRHRSEMAEHQCLAPTLKEVLERLEQFAPAAYASSWDNVGLLVNPNSDSPIRTILLTNDLTEEIVEEAKSAKVQLIITYHPNIFEALKSVSTRSWKERIVVECIKSNIAVYSPHTAWDAIKGGVNDWLAKSLPVDTSTPIIQQFQVDIGFGRFCTLSREVSISEAINLIKKHIGIKHLRLALAKGKSSDSLIKTFAVCAGSGSTILNGIEADLYLTGEMLHHDILNATQNGRSVILCDHSNSERGYLGEFAQIFQKTMFNNVKVIQSRLDRDPLMTV